MRDQVIEAAAAKLRAGLDAAVTPETLEKIKTDIEKVARDIHEQVYDDLKDNLAYELVEVAKSMASASIDAMMAGDANAFRNHISLHRFYNGREQTSAEWDGRLRDSLPIELRRKLVEAHADLLRDERRADLESQIKGLEKITGQQSAELREVKHAKTLATGSLCEALDFLKTLGYPDYETSHMRHEREAREARERREQEQRRTSGEI